MAGIKKINSSMSLTSSINSIEQSIKYALVMTEKKI